MPGLRAVRGWLAALVGVVTATVFASQALATVTVSGNFSTSGITLQGVTCSGTEPVDTSCPKSSLVFSISSDNLADSGTVSFVATLPSNLRLATPYTEGGTCPNAAAAISGTAGGTTATVSGLQIVPGGLCTVFVDVVSFNGALNGSCSPTQPAAFTMLPGNFSGVSGATVNPLNASCLTVGTFAALTPPAVRQGQGGLNCTANDVSVGQIVVNGTSQCIFGQPVTLNISANLTTTATQRYDIGIFFSGDGKDLQAIPANNGATFASAITLTTAMGVVTNVDGDACLDTSSGTVTNYPLGNINIICTPNPTTGLLDLVTLVTWNQGASATDCGGPQDVNVGTKSKCTTGVTNTPVAVVGQINIKKVTVPAADPTSFNFTAANTTTPGTPPSPTAFSLTDGVTQLVQTAPLKQAGENYLITETTDPNFTLTSIVCTDGSGATAPNVTINVANGTVQANMSTTNGIVNCTYTNTKKSTLTVVKALSPATDAGKFNLTAGTTTVNDQGNGGTTGAVAVAAGVAVTASETAGTGTTLSDYTSTYSCIDSGTQTPLTSGSGTSVQVTPQAAQNVVCTFTNARKPSVTVVKSLVPSSDGGLFNLSAGATTVNNQGNGGTATTTAVTLGNGVLVQETAGTGTNLANYSTTYSCNDEAASQGSGTQVTVTPTANVPAITCTFTNTRLTNVVTLNKILNPGADTGTFNLVINGTTVASGVGNGGTGNVVAVPVGSTVTISESAAGATNLANYNTAVACAPATVTPGANNQSGTFTMPNAAVTCNFTNTRKQIQLTLQKQWTNAALNDQVTISAGAHQFVSVANGANELDADAPIGVDAGSTIALSEAFNVGSAASYGTTLQCTGNTTPLSGGNLTVVATDPPVTCTFTNTLLVNPALTKSFNPTSILSGGTTVLTFTVTNPPTGSTRVVTFTDALPSGLQLADGTVGGTCAGYTITDAANATLAAGSTSVKVTNLTINANQTCTITVNVTNKQGPAQLNTDCSTNPAAFTNSSGNVSGLTNLDNLVQPSCVIVSTLPTLTKAFSPTTITVGGTTVLTLTVDNTQAGSLARSGITFTDVLPSSLVLANGTVGGTCAGYTITDNANAALAAGSTSVKVTALSIAQNASCTITVNVTNVPQQTNPTCGTPPAFTNAAGNVSNLTTIVNGVQPSCVVVNPLPPVLTKSFSPTTINVGGTTTLTFTLANPAANPALNNVGFVDTLPSGLQVANPAAVGGTCANAAAATTATAGSGTITVANLQLAAGASSCTVTVNVTNVPLQVNPTCPAGNFTNTSTNITSTTVDNQVQDSCVVVNPLTPSLNKAFSPTTINVGGTTTLTFTVTNPAAFNPAQAVSFTDTLPLGLQVAAAPNVQQTCTGGTITATAGTNVITVTGVTVGASGASASTCTVSVDITNVPGQTGTCPAANFTNTSVNISGTSNITNAVTDSCVNVNPLVPTLDKSFSPTTINIGGTTTLTFTVTNPANNPALSNVGFVDTLPSGLIVQTPANVGGTCANAAAATTATAGSNTITVANLQVPAGQASCTVTVDITNAAGQTNASCVGNPVGFTNTAANVTVTNVTNAINPSCVIVNPLVPTLTKSFSPTTINVGGTTTLTFTVANPAGNPALTNVGFVDTLPTGLIVATPNGVGGTCANAAAATVATAGSGTITVSNLQVAAGASSCTVTVNITNATGQTNSSCATNPTGFTNTAANVTVTNVTNGIQPSCVIVNPLTPTLTKSFSPTTIDAGGVTTLTFTVTNPANNPALANAGFVDNLPSGLQVAGVPAIGGTCANAAAATTATAGSSTITVANLQVAAGASSCTVTVNVTNKPGQANPSCATQPAAFTNAAGNVTVTNLTNGIQPSCVVVNTFSFTITKTASQSQVVPGAPLSFTIVVTNNGPSVADGSVITDPAIADFSASSVTCVATTGGATCPAPLSVAALQSTGMSVTTFPAGASITLRIDGTTTLSSGTMTNVVTVSPPAGTPGVASASASAVVAAQIGVIPTLSVESLIVLMLVMAGLGAVVYRRKATPRR